MEFRTTSSPHLEDRASVSGVMLQVLLALVPGIAVGFWLFGWGIVTNLVLAVVFALGLEAGTLMLRGRPVTIFLSDYSAVLTACLLALALPPLSAWWLILVGMFFAIVIAKHLYGGLGYNPFNPAMVGYVVLLISFPTQMTMWVSPSLVAEQSLNLSQSLLYVFTGSLPADVSWDVLTRATALDTGMVARNLGQDIKDVGDTLHVGWVGADGRELMGAAYLLGGIWLIFRGIIDWRSPLAMLLALAAPAALLHAIAPEQYASALFHLFSGATMMGAFFILTDPVSGCSSTRGRIVFAIGVGLLVFIIRSWGGFPDGVAFAVLLMNMSAPMIDYYTRPRVFGEGR